jgi:hypothetical protein
LFLLITAGGVTAHALAVLGPLPPFVLFREVAAPLLLAMAVSGALSTTHLMLCHVDLASV